jgi:hypothetical protein
VKREEAESIWGIISALYDLHPERNAEQAVVWIPALEEMDGEIVMAIVQQWMRGNAPDKMPKLPTFVHDVKAEVKRRNPVQPGEAECDLCEDNGLVAMATGDSRYPEASVPCPSCDRGRAIEFPLEARGAWGPDGFWRGRAWEIVGHGEVAFSE